MKVKLPIKCDELTLRRVTERDYADLCDYYTAPEVARYQFWEPFTDEQVAHLVGSQADVMPGDPGVAFVLVVVLQAEDRVIGDCSLTITSCEDRQADIGFAFNPRNHGNGYATKAVNATLGFGFRELGLHRISGASDVRNERSWKLMERIGMRREAHFIHDCYSKGEWVDDYLYAMIEDEWPKIECCVDER